MHIRVLESGEAPEAQAVARLYASVGWSAYTRDLGTLLAGIRASRTVVTAWIEEELVGLARVVGDGHTIAYLQDVLVDPQHQRSGIATHLVQAAFELQAGVRQQVLLTDGDPAQRAFYQHLGFTEIADFEAPLACFVRFRA